MPAQKYRIISDFSCARKSSAYECAMTIVLSSWEHFYVVIFNFSKLVNILCRFQEVAESPCQKAGSGLYAQSGEGTILQNLASVQHWSAGDRQLVGLL